MEIKTIMCRTCKQDFKSDYCTCGSCNTCHDKMSEMIDKLERNPGMEVLA